MHTGKELEAHKVEKGRLSCDSDAPQVGSARSGSTRVIKANHCQTNCYKLHLAVLFVNTDNTVGCQPSELVTLLPHNNTVEQRIDPFTLSSTLTCSC
jgi:hypothetical protein